MFYFDGGKKQLQGILKMQVGFEAKHFAQWSLFTAHSVSCHAALISAPHVDVQLLSTCCLKLFCFLIGAACAHSVSKHTHTACITHFIGLIRGLKKCNRVCVYSSS